MDLEQKVDKALKIARMGVGRGNQGVADAAASTGTYTDEKAQDAVGTILADSSTIDFTYNDGAPSITAIVKDASLGTAKLGGDITAAGTALLDDANAGAQRTTLGLGTLATQSGTFSGTSSGTNTGDQTNISGNAATVTTNANLTGPITSTGNATAVASQTGTGSKFVMDTSPTLVTPLLGTPTSGTLTSCTGLPVSTGISGLAANIATFLATPSSANLAAALTDETGSGANVHATSPTLVTPLLGTPTSGTLTNCTGLPAAGISDSTAAGRTLLTAADAGAQRTALSILAQTHFHLTADATGITSITPANVTSVVLAVASGLYYSFEFSLIVRTDALTFSPVVAFTTPTFNVMVCEVIGPTGVAQAITASGGSVTVAALPSTNTDYLITVKGIINPSAAGNIRPQLAVSAALGTLTCRRATSGILTLLTA